MKKLSSIRIFFVLSVLTFSSSYSQNFDLIGYLSYGVGHKSWIVYDYEYVEFNQSAYLDSSIILESFSGTLTVAINNTESNSDTTQYNLSIFKEGSKISRTFYDTLLVENIDVEFIDSVFVVNDINEPGGSRHIFGWIFPDTLMESITDSLDSIPMYPYSRLYRFYNTSDDDSLYQSDDTLIIHYRPKQTNNNDSSFSIDYVLNLTFDVRSYSRHLSYFGEGFNETLKYKSASWASVNNPDISNIANNISLSQNYPNPFNPKTKIKFSLLHRTSVKLVIYDILGNIISTILDDVRNSGDYELEFDGSNLSSGIYYYRLFSNKNGVSKKFVILK